MTEEDRITIAKQKVQTYCEALYPAMHLHITGVAPLDPTKAWPRLDDPENGSIDGVPTPNEMWRVFVDVFDNDRSGTVEAGVACWHAGTEVAGLDRLPLEISRKLDRVFTKEEKISIERAKVTRPW